MRAFPCNLPSPGFVDHKYDVNILMRTTHEFAAYHVLQIAPVNAARIVLFMRITYRRLSAEVILDPIRKSTEVPTPFSITFATPAGFKLLTRLSGPAFVFAGCQNCPRPFLDAFAGRTARQPCFRRTASHDCHVGQVRCISTMGSNSHDSCRRPSSRVDHCLNEKISDERGDRRRLFFGLVRALERDPSSNHELKKFKNLHRRCWPTKEA